MFLRCKLASLNRPSSGLSQYYSSSFVGVCFLQRYVLVFSGAVTSNRAQAGLYSIHEFLGTHSFLKTSNSVILVIN